MTLLGGSFEQLEFCVAAAGGAGSPVAFYSESRHAGPSSLIFGNATLAKDGNGKPIVHCHAAFRTESSKLKGGHLITQSCIVKDAVTVVVTTLEGFELRVAFDAETNISLIQPADL